MLMNGRMERISMHHEQTRNYQFHLCTCSRLRIACEFIWGINVLGHWLAVAGFGTKSNETYPSIQVCNLSGLHVSKKWGLNSPNNTYKRQTNRKFNSKLRHIGAGVGIEPPPPLTNDEHTLRPSTTNKCKMQPNKYSLNHRHARPADSIKRDDFNDTGTK